MFDYKFSLSASAGVSQSVNAKGSSIYYYEETGGGADVSVVITAEGGAGGSFVLRPGEGVRLPESANAFKVANNVGSNTIVGTLKIGEGDFAGKNIAGSVSVSNSPTVSVSNIPAVSGASVSHSQKTVTNASGQHVAGNATRRYLLIQNNDATGNIWVRIDGTAATTATGVKIPPGGSWEITGWLSENPVTMIGDIASNANVVVVEGAD